MLRFPKALVHSAQIASVVVTVDAVLSYGLTFFGLSFSEIAGDLMLVEAAVFFLLGGLLDFSSSTKGADLRKAFLGSKEEYSVSTRKLAESRVKVFFLSGGILLTVLILVAMLTNS